MKPFIQKLSLGQDNSFVARTFRTPLFEVGWHQHIEYELILFTEGNGVSFVGNHVGEFNTDDIYFLGTNLPHTFQKRDADMITSAIVVQFRADCWGADFWQMPETRAVQDLLDISSRGLKLASGLCRRLAPLIKELEFASGMKRILLLGECLHQIAVQGDFMLLSTLDATSMGGSGKNPIDKVFEYTIQHFKDEITVKQMASLACMSVPTFCSHFKKSTQKTYIDFLNEVRVGFACSLLVGTDQAVLDICFECGYNTHANFYKQFLRIMRITPLQYRKKFIGSSRVN